MKSAQILRVNCQCTILRMQLAKNALGSPYFRIAERSAGEQISGQQNEVEEINQYISDSFFPLCSMGINFFFTLFYLLQKNALLTCLYLVPVLVVTFYTGISGKVIYRHTKQEQEQNQGEAPPRSGMNDKQREQVLNAIQAQEDKTQEKLKEKAGVIIRGSKSW